MKLIFVHARKNAGTSIIEYLHSISADFDVTYEYQDQGVNQTTFGVVRNPYDRCLSSWKYCHSTKSRSLLDALQNPPRDGEINREKLHHQPGHDYRHFTRTQSSYLYRPDRTKRVTALLSFENLYEDLQDLLDIFGIETAGRPLPRLNVTEHPPVESLTDLEREAIYNFYREDFINFGYPP